MVGKRKRKERAQVSGKLTQGGAGAWVPGVGGLRVVYVSGCSRKEQPVAPPGKGAWWSRADGEAL